MKSGTAGRRIGDWMQTYSGNQFWPCDPKPEDIYLGDIAHALAMQCRYGGHCLVFYSVAEHCVHVSSVVEPELAARALLHDAAEAYLVDIPRPLKSQPAFREYKILEHRLEHALAARFGIPLDWDENLVLPAIKRADNDVLATEKEQIMAPQPEAWTGIGEPVKGLEIHGWLPYEAEQAFLRRARELGLR